MTNQITKQEENGMHSKPKARQKPGKKKMAPPKQPRDPLAGWDLEASPHLAGMSYAWKQLYAAVNKIVKE